MGPIGHTVVSGAVGGGVWLATGSPMAAGVALGIGVLIDIDHLYDYYQRYANGRRNKIYVLGHAWEYSGIGVAVLALVFYHPVLLGAVLGHFAHVATDHFMNRLSPFAYSISYRLIKGFDKAYIAPHRHVEHSHRRLAKMLPFERRLQLWILRRTKQWFLARARRISGKPAHTIAGDD